MICLTLVRPIRPNWDASLEFVMRIRVRGNTMDNGNDSNVTIIV